MEPTIVVERKGGYSGVCWDKKRREWSIKVCVKGKTINFTPQDELDLAVWISDFARYMVWGLDLNAYHHLAGKPTRSPSERFDYPRAGVLSKLVDASVVPDGVLAERLRQYDEVVRKRKPGAR